MAYDFAAFRNAPSFSDYMRLEDEFRMKKEQAARQAQMDALTMQKAQKEIETGAASNDPAAVREWQFFSKLPDAERTKYLQMKRADQIMNLGGNMAVRSPTGGIQEAYPVTPRTVDMPEFQAMQEGAKERASMNVQLGNAAALEHQKSLGEKTGSLLGDQMGEFAGNEKILPIVRSLRVMNENSPTIPYAGKTQWARRLYPGTSEAEAAVDLMKQARIEIAAPLAKQLGVNPTDKDFLASLDRIFDIEATKESRERQINALEQRLLGRQMQLSERIGIPPMDASMLDAQIPALTVPTPPTPMDRADQEFKARKNADNDPLGIR